MKISLQWLQDFVELGEQDPRELARRITASVGEVEHMEIQGELLQHCCTGKVLSVRPHPNADRLSICVVQTDQGEKRVVCGGTNVRVGMNVAFAHIGARVRWHGEELTTLEAVKIRGEASEGMICAAEELDLQARFPARPEEGERPILDLGEGDEHVGKSLKEFLGLNDVVFHIDNHAITHRADLFSHLGVARELVALGLATWKKKSSPKSPRFAKAPLPFGCINEVKDLVPRYCGCLLTFEKLGETPAWMKRRLEATGWRSISLPVDITNYVTMELGMPLHSFDADDLKGDVHIRLSAAGETIQTLDGVTRALPQGAVVLSDDLGIFDLLGIMGGLRSSTKPETKRIFLHAAAVDPVAIRRAIIATGHRTDAATVYEKGIPRMIVQRGFLRALELFLELVPGAKISSAMETLGDDGTARTIDLRLDRINAVLGANFSKDRVLKILTDLGFGTKASRGKDITLKVTVPLHRLGDIKGEHDLVEEVGRIAGYDSIEPVLPQATIAPPPRDDRVHRLRDAHKERGYFEILPLSLVGSALLNRAGMGNVPKVELQNALGEETSLLQPSTLPGLLEHTQRNLPLTSVPLKTFRRAHVFSPGAKERDELGFLLASHERSPLLAEHPFLHLKRDVVEALKSIGYAATLVPMTESLPAAHPGQCAQVQVLGHTVGTLFTLHPDIAQAFDIPFGAACTLDLDALLQLRPQETYATSLPQYPSIAYDETLPLSPSDHIGDRVRHVQPGEGLLSSIDIVDVYQDAKAKEGAYHLTLRFTYQAPDRTLTEDEARKAHEETMKKLR